MTAEISPAAVGRRLAVDIGGTFTDAVCAEPDGTLGAVKVLSVPGEQDAGVIDAAARLGADFDSLAGFVHGTTAGLNALLERRGANFALVTTKGFRDVYEIGRANRPAMYDIHYRRPPMLLRRRSIFEVSERVAATGEELVPLDEDELRRLAGDLGSRYEAVAVCFLHAYRWPEHEQIAARLIAETAPSLSVVTSHEVAAEWREYERTSTTCVSTYVTPRIREYLGRLEERMQSGGMRCDLRIMQSNGGAISARDATRNAVRTLFSGPVGGTVAGAMVGRQLAADQLICVDMGGTSFDMSLVVDRGVAVESQFEIMGHPVLAPAVAIHSLGAGGGSIIHLETGGLRVGPRSAGGVPGPACYGRGGTEPTVTDANVLLGRIPHEARLGGTLPLDIASLEKALLSVANEIGLDIVELALGAVEIVDATMADGIREITVARGIDPRQFSLLAFGGAGPLHAAALADELDIRRVIIPFNPGVFSAWGMLQADTRHDVVRSFYAPLDGVDPEEVHRELEELRQRGSELLAAEGAGAEAMFFDASVDLRYVGQEYAITVPLKLGFDETARRELRDEFHAGYLRRFGHSNPAEAAEIVSLRVAARAPAAPLEEVALPRSGPPVPTGRTTAIFASGRFDAPVYVRGTLGRGSTLDGPCVVLEDACTTLVPPGWSGAVSPHGHIVMEPAR